MNSPFDLLYITPRDFKNFKKSNKSSKVTIVLNLVLDELPKELKKHKKFITPQLKSIKGFEDDQVKGYEIVIEENKKIEDFVRSYIPFFILRKDGR